MFQKETEGPCDTTLLSITAASELHGFGGGVWWQELCQWLPSADVLLGIMRTTNTYSIPCLIIVTAPLGCAFYIQIRAYRLRCVLRCHALRSGL